MLLPGLPLFLAVTILVKILRNDVVGIDPRRKTAGSGGSVASNGFGGCKHNTVILVCTSYTERRGGEVQGELAAKVSATHRS